MGDDEKFDMDDDDLDLGDDSDLDAGDDFAGELESKVRPDPRVQGECFISERKRVRNRRFETGLEFADGSGDGHGRDSSAVKGSREPGFSHVSVRFFAAKHLDESLEFCTQAAGDQIEYIEEPLADISQYPTFFDSTDMPVAFDETLAELDDVDELDHLDKVKAFILKPSLLGGLCMTGQFIALAFENDIMPVMSCTFGSDLSSRSFALFAAMYGAADIPLGLDTMKWFKHHLLTEGFKVESGRIEIADLVNRPVPLQITELRRNVGPSPFGGLAVDLLGQPTVGCHGMLRQQRLDLAALAARCLCGLDRPGHLSSSA